MSSAFVTPAISLDQAGQGDLRTLPELVSFHVRENPHHLFAVQAEHGGGNTDTRYRNVNYEDLSRAIHECQRQIVRQIPGLKPLAQGLGLPIAKPPPVAILMESHLGLAVYILTLMGLGVPVLLLSTRLSPDAIYHLVEATGAKHTIASQPLHGIAQEALKLNRAGDDDSSEKGTNSLKNGSTKAQIHIAANHQAFFDSTHEAAGEISIAHDGHYVSEEDRNVVVLHSSGTSGLPKPIYCSHRHFLGFSQCHRFTSPQECQGLTISTSPFFHGFGLVPLCLSLGIGKTFVVPAPGRVPTGLSVAAMIEQTNARMLLTVPAILEEIFLLPDQKGVNALRSLDVVAFGGGLPKTTTGAALDEAGVNLINHYGATETGPLTPFFVPARGHDWHFIQLREDIAGPLDMRLTNVERDEGSGHQPGKAYKLSMRPFGWTERFELQDLLLSNPSSGRKEFSIAGRTDDLICLATGEKVRPTDLETALRQHDGVKHAVTVGSNRFELALLIEPVRALVPGEAADLKARLWPTIQEAGRHMDTHARIASLASVLIVEPGALPKTDKGTILRREVDRVFADDISTLYRGLEDTGVEVIALDWSDPEGSIRAMVAEMIVWRVPLDEGWSNDSDFFEMGMDSLQATRLRRLLASSVEASGHSGRDRGRNAMITEDFVYRFSSVKKLATQLLATSPGVVSTTEAGELQDLVDRFSQTPVSKAIVVLTGATGSLGSFLLNRLLADVSVNKVICLNRPSEVDGIQRQKAALGTRGISLADTGLWAKVEVYQTNTAASYLGLGYAVYQSIAERMTHLVHTAWPMSFKMTLSSYNSSFQTLQNLIGLVRSSAAHCLGRGQQRPRLLFISSISTVGNYPATQGERIVPEVAVEDHRCTLELGYAKAKFVCEQIIQRVNAEHPEVEVAFVRVGQIAGARTGFWNVDEHFVALVASSRKIMKFPDLQGTLSWLPVDLAADALAEITLNHDHLRPVYHLENPVRQGWPEVASKLAVELGINADSIIPLEAWLEMVASAPEAGNPARKLLGFLRNEFVHMSCGGVILDTHYARSASPTLRAVEEVGDDIIRLFVSYWKTVGVLE